MLYSKQIGYVVTKAGLPQQQKKSKSKVGSSSIPDGFQQCLPDDPSPGDKGQVDKGKKMIQETLRTCLEHLVPSPAFSAEIRDTHLPAVPRSALIDLLKLLSSCDLGTWLSSWREEEAVQRAAVKRTLGTQGGLFGRSYFDLRSGRNDSGHPLEALVKLANACLDLAERKELGVDRNLLDKLFVLPMLIISKAYTAMGATFSRACMKHSS
jgi:hypothetical protein